jgi:hypothetical protein
MFATECSNPDVINNQIGKKIANILPIAFSAPVAIQTARQTSQLHKIPRQNASIKVK